MSDLTITDNAIVRAIFERHMQSEVDQYGVPITGEDDEAFASRITEKLSEAERAFILHESIKEMVNEIVAEDIVAGRVVVVLDDEGDTCFQKVKA